MKILFTMLKEENIDPLNVELLSALAKQGGHETFLSVLEHGELERDLKAIRPDVVAFSAKTGESNVMFDVAREIKGSFGDDVLTIMGGPHPTFNYSRMRLRGETLEPPPPRPGAQALPVEETHMDYLAVGESDEAWPELLSRLAAGAAPDDVPGIVTRANRRADGTIALRDRANFLDDLPFHDRALVYDKTQLKYFGMRTFISQRGCPYPCTYCFNAKFNELYKRKGKTINRYSVDRLLEELLDIKRNYDTQFIKFYDDMFVFHADDWLREFSEKYPKVIGVPFHCLTRCDLVHKDPEMIDLMRAAGLHSITMSIESGNDFVRRHTFKRTMTEEEIRFAFDYCARKGVKTFSNTILAIPAPVIPKVDDPRFEEKAAGVVAHLATHFPRIKREAFESILAGGPPLAPPARRELTDRLQALGLRHDAIDYDIESLDINVNCRVTSGEFVMLSPYPGTPLTDYTIAIGAFDGDYEKLHETFQSESPFRCFTEEEKMKQLNISFLGVFLLVFPGLRNFAVKHLVKRPWTRLYFLLYFLVRGYVLGMRIYPMRYSFRQLLGKVRASFVRELTKHFADEGRKFNRKRRLVLAPASDVLGGPWKG
ncbi:MAG TPA: radical SAM protein [Thermoanaerobaculia bacterium]|nr:radical SAM protein [Thermoanaerobaculia bacterium]